MASRFGSLWNSPVGPKTTHFWAPLAKLCVAGASFADYFRPADQISMSQQGALMVTGSIWTRWCFVITPKNYALAAINASVGLGGAYQFFRAYNWHANHPETSLKQHEQAVLQQKASTEKMATKEASVGA